MHHRARLRRRRVKVEGGRSLRQERERGLVIHAVGDSEHDVALSRHEFGVGAGAAVRDDTLAGVRPDPSNLATRHQRQRRLEDVLILARVEIAKVHARAVHRDQNVFRPRDGLLDFDRQ